ncbi:MAG: hypothetical protein QXM93_08470 [Candidatus Methanomethyliaceae archaeon]
MAELLNVSLLSGADLAYVKATILSSGVIALRRLPQSKFRSSFIFPPPSTFIGALFYPLLRDVEKRETLYEVSQMAKRGRGGAGFEVVPRSVVEKYKCLVRNFSVRVVGEGFIDGGLLKINWYDTHPDRMEIKQAATSLPFSVYYGTSDNKFEAVYFIDVKKLEEFNISLKEIVRAAYGISRLGSRESVVHSDFVSFGEVTIESVSETETSYSFVLDYSKSVSGNYSLQQVSDWRIEVTNPEKAPKILLAYPKGRVTVKGKVNVAKIEGDYIVVE